MIKPLPLSCELRYIHKQTTLIVDKDVPGGVAFDMLYGVCVTKREEFNYIGGDTAHSTWHLVLLWRSGVRLCDSQRRAIGPTREAGAKCSN